MQIQFLAVALTACFAPAPQQPIGPSPNAAVDTKTSIFGEPLYVNGRRVGDDEIKLAVIYNSCRSVVDNAKIGVIIEDEISRHAVEKADAEIAAKEKAKPFENGAARTQARTAAIARFSSLLHEKYRVPDEEFEEEYQRNVDEFRKSYPLLDTGAEICRAYRTVDQYRDQLRQTMYFDRVFLPENPAEWPATSVEAIRADDTGGDIFLPDAQASYDARLKEAEKNGGKLPREEELFMSFLREIVRNAVFDQMSFKTRADGIDPKLALWADTNGDGKPEAQFTIDEFWNKVQDSVSETEIDEAKQYWITSLATRDRLAKDGALLSDEEIKKVLCDVTHAQEVNLRLLEDFGVRGQDFPSAQAFIEYCTLRGGYRKLIAPKLAPGPGGEISPVLREYFDRANKVMGLGRIDCEVMLVSAMDIPRFRWKKDGWNWAKKTAQDLREQIDQNKKAFMEQRAQAAEAQKQGKEFKPEKPAPDPDRFWSQMLDDHSEYYDPPPPEKHGAGDQSQSSIGYKNKGRFGSRFRNDLIAYVGETVYSEWVSGQCLTDMMFFDQAENSVAGPYKGPLGYYLTRVKRRTAPGRTLNLAEPVYVGMLQDDYVRWSFAQYTKEAVAQAEIKGR